MMRDSPGPVAAAFVRVIVKHPWLTAAAVGILVAAAGLVVLLSGVVPIKASSGHWTITATLLDFAKVRSVAIHSFGIQPPSSLDDPALVLRGAGHYESGCYPCHGRPGARIPPVMAAMTPAPPELPNRIARWRPEELFSIVKHGIKFTGMPAWPVQQRDDEVWAVVAFLRKMPTLDAGGYEMLVYGGPRAAGNVGRVLPPSLEASADRRSLGGGGSDPPDPEARRAVREICWRCHGADGTGRGPGAFPSLAGQRPAYLDAQLRAFADRSRFSGIMSTIATNLRDQTMREIAEHYAALPSRQENEPADASAIERGEALAARGIPDENVPSCADCHGPGDTPRNPAYPVLAGQHPRYLALQLELFKERRRGGSDYANIMHVVVNRLGPEQIRDVAVYYASLEGER